MPKRLKHPDMTRGGLPYGICWRCQKNGTSIQLQTSWFTLVEKRPGVGGRGKFVKSKTRSFCEECAEEIFEEMRLVLDKQEDDAVMWNKRVFDAVMK